MDTTPLWVLLIIAGIVWAIGLYMLWRNIRNSPLLPGEYSALDRADGLTSEERYDLTGRN